MLHTINVAYMIEKKKRNTAKNVEYNSRNNFDLSNGFHKPNVCKIRHIKLEIFSMYISVGLLKSIALDMFLVNFFLSKICHSQNEYDWGRTSLLYSFLSYRKNWRKNIFLILFLMEKIISFFFLVRRSYLFFNSSALSPIQVMWMSVNFLNQLSHNTPSIVIASMH